MGPRSGSIAGVRYGHTSIVAADWRTLAQFYVELFGCVPVPPEREYRGEDLERGTGVPGAALRGAHLRLPGHGDAGPTLEIYEYDRAEDRCGPTAANRLGLAHLAFAVDNVSTARQRVLAAGGRAVGEIVTLTIADGRRVTWCYVTDPEGGRSQPTSPGALKVE